MIRLRSHRTALATSFLTAMIAFGGLTAVEAGATTVPNYYSRTCSHLTGRCTPYVQTNRHDNSAPNWYSTNWCWCVV